MAIRPKLRVLCFGDSLTAGYTSMGMVYHPYKDKLQQMLEMAFPDLDIATFEEGEPGDTVKYGFLPRMQRQFPRGRKSEELYDWTIVLGGTNDLAYSIKPEDIFDKLKEIWDVPLRRKSKVLALTVPEVGVEEAYKREGFHVFDLAGAMPYFSLAQPDREKYWDDAIHFTPDGYDQIGKVVGMALVRFLEQERARNPPPTKKRRLFRDDDKVFEEEDGDPSSLAGGYVVVRHKDLD